MSEKRRDSKGRLLHDNEFQRKDGRYEYRYYDQNGKRCSLYSWRLTAADRQPAGKRPCQPLRDLEKTALEEPAQCTTLNDYFERYIASKVGVKPSTIETYRSAYEKHVRPAIGLLRIQEIHFSDVQAFYLGLIKIGLSPKRIANIDYVVHPSLELAKRDGVISVNPADHAFREVARLSHAAPRHGLTEEEQAEFLHYITSDPKSQGMRPILVCLLGTGCRISEMLALRWDDVDFDRNVIHICHSLTTISKQAHLTTPKTYRSVRDIPLLREVRSVLEERREVSKGFKPLVIDGYSGFVWQNPDGTMPLRNGMDVKLRTIIDRHNREAKPGSLLLPHFSVHQLRHTFCTRLCEHETDLKLIQEIMGHASIHTTMDIYNESNAARKQDSFSRLQASQVIFGN